MAYGLYTHEQPEQKGVPEHIFKDLQTEGIIEVRVKFICLDSTTLKVHPDACGALKKTENKQLAGVASGLPQKFIWLPRLTDLH